MIDLAPIKKHLKDIQSADGWKATIRANHVFDYAFIELISADRKLFQQQGTDRLEAWSEIAADAQHLLNEVVELRGKLNEVRYALEVIATGQDDDELFSEEDEDGFIDFASDAEIARKALEILK